MFPTPKARDWKKSSLQSEHHAGVTLSDAVRMLPTPTAADAKSVRCYARGNLSLAATVNDQLNADWVDDLMLLPVGWTDCDWPAMESCPIKPSSGSARYSEGS